MGGGGSVLIIVTLLDVFTTELIKALAFPFYVICVFHHHHVSSSANIIEETVNNIVFCSKKKKCSVHLEQVYAAVLWHMQVLNFPSEQITHFRVGEVPSSLTLEAWS